MKNIICILLCSFFLYSSTIDNSYVIKIDVEITQKEIKKILLTEGWLISEYYTNNITATKRYPGDFYGIPFIGSRWEEQSISKIKLTNDYIMFETIVQERRNKNFPWRNKTMDDNMTSAQKIISKIYATE